MTTVRLAFTGHTGRRQIDAIKGPHMPALLISFFYLSDVKRHWEELRFRDWVLDSGAYSASNSGAVINLPLYIMACKDLMKDQQLTEIFALDVIGDWKASRTNTEAMWKAGIPAIPCFHVGEPEHVLLDLARDYPKIALGGLVGLPFVKKLAFIKDCFNRVWPKRIHGFGLADERILMSVPFESVDATNWDVGPGAFGRWNSLGNLKTPAPKDLTSEVRWFLALERKTKAVWRREMQTIGAPC